MRKQSMQLDDDLAHLFPRTLMWQNRMVVKKKASGDKD